MGHLGTYFSHYGGFDSASARTDMWAFGVRELAESGMWLSGFGTGTQNIALTPLFGVSSFHNMYIELLFEGGDTRIACSDFDSGLCCAREKNAAFAEAHLLQTLLATAYDQLASVLHI